MENKTLLIDHLSHKVAAFTVNEVKTKDGIKRMTLIGKLQEAEVRNGNGRIYPRETLMREIQKYVDGPVKTRTSTGELDHPESSVINLTNVSHVITRVWWDGDNVMGEIELLNTPSGRIAQEIVAAGIPLGISSRAMGSVKQIGEAVEVQDDLELLAWDLVSVPSTSGAYLQLKEGKYGSFNRYAKINQDLTEILCSYGGRCEVF